MLNELIARIKRRKRKLSEFGQALYESFQEDGWVQERHYLMHKNSGLRMWTSNGAANFHPYDDGELDAHREVLALWEKEYLWVYRKGKCSNREFANRLRLSNMKGTT